MTTELIDANDGKPWSEMDLWDLKNSLEYWRLDRGGGGLPVPQRDDRRGAGLTYRSEPLPPARPTHKITKTDVVRIGERYGVEGATVHEFQEGEEGEGPASQGLGPRDQRAAPGPRGERRRADVIVPYSSYS